VRGATINRHRSRQCAVWIAAWLKIREFAGRWMLISTENPGHLILDASYNGALRFELVGSGNAIIPLTVDAAGPLGVRLRPPPLAGIHSLFLPLRTAFHTTTALALNIFLR